MSGALVAVLVVAAVLAYRAGSRHRAFSLARADVRAQRGKLRAARQARTALGRIALAGWTLLLVCVVVAALVFAL